MRIALLANHFGEPWAEGGKNNLRRVARALAADHELVVMGLGPRTEQLEVDGLRVHRFRSPMYTHRLARVGYPIGYLRLLARAREALQSYDPHLIFSYFETASTAAVSTTLRRLWAPRASLVHTVWSDWFAPTRLPIRHWMSEAVPQALLNGRLQSALGLHGVDQVLVTSHYLGRQVDRLGHDAVLTPNGIDTVAFAPAADRTAPGAGDVFRVGYLGHATYAKGVSLLLDAMRHLLDLETNLELRLAVSADAEESSLIARLSHPRIQVEGLVDPTDFYNAVDLVVLPRRFSYGTASYPRVLLEAMACGTPVLTARISDAEEVIRHDQNGFLFHAGDVTDLRHQIVRVFRQRSQLAAVGQQARATALEHDWAQVLPSLLGAIEQLAPNAASR